MLAPVLTRDSRVDAVLGRLMPIGRPSFEILHPEIRHSPDVSVRAFGHSFARRHEQRLAGPGVVVVS